MKLKSYSFIIAFINLNLTFYHSFSVSLEAPHYEAAVAQALVIGHQYIRNHDKDEEMFMRIMKN